MRGALRILFADASRDHRGGGHAEADGDRINDRQNRLSESYGGHGILAQPAHKKNIDNGEHGFHTLFQDHRYRQKNNGTADAARGKILVMS